MLLFCYVTRLKPMPSQISQFRLLPCRVSTNIKLFLDFSIKRAKLSDVLQQASSENLSLCCMIKRENVDAMNMRMRVCSSDLLSAHTSDATYTTYWLKVGTLAGGAIASLKQRSCFMKFKNLYRVCSVLKQDENIFKFYFVCTSSLYVVPL